MIKFLLQGNADCTRYRGPGTINTLPRRIPESSYPTNHLPTKFLLSPNSSAQQGQSPPSIRDQFSYNPQDFHHLPSPRNRNVFISRDGTLPMQDMGLKFHRHSLKSRVESGSSSQSSSSIAPTRSGNLRSSLESLISGVQQPRQTGQQAPTRKTVTFKGDVQTIQCSPEEQQERRCWRHQNLAVSCTTVLKFIYNC